MKMHIHIIINYKYKWSIIAIKFIRMSLDILHNELIKHYRTNSVSKQKKNIKKESVVRQSYLQKETNNNNSSKFDDFLKN